MAVAVGHLVGIGLDQPETLARQAEAAKIMTEVVEQVSAVVAASAEGDYSQRVGPTRAGPELQALVDGVNAINAAVDQATQWSVDLEDPQPAPASSSSRSSGRTRWSFRPGSG